MKIKSERKRKRKREKEGFKEDREKRMWVKRNTEVNPDDGTREKVGWGEGRGKRHRGWEGEGGRPYVVCLMVGVVGASFGGWQ